MYKTHFHVDDPDHGTDKHIKDMTILFDFNTDERYMTFDLDLGPLMNDTQQLPLRISSGIDGKQYDNHHLHAPSLMAKVSVRAMAVSPPGGG